MRMADTKAARGATGPSQECPPEMEKRVAVITDAVAADFIFPIWQRYYGGLFGHNNLFVVTYAGLAGRFRDCALGGVIELPVAYDDGIRHAIVSHLVAALLVTYDTVVRVDADEFLVVDPRASASLADFLQTDEAPYLTARGFDVIQLTGEPALAAVPAAPILSERRFAYPNTALNKTTVVRTPVRWEGGFHCADVYPRFGPLFLLHMKRIDIGWQLAWFRRMTENISANPKAENYLKDYYAPDEVRIRDYHAGVENRTRLAGIESWYREAFTADFLAHTQLTPHNGIYQSRFDHEDVLCEIVPEWKALI